MPLEPKIAINPSSFSPASLLHTTQDFLIELDMKACLYLVEISIFLLNIVTIKPTKIKNTAKQKLGTFLENKVLKK